MGLTEAQAREQHGDEVSVGRMPFSANARAQMYAEKTGWVKTIHENRYGELLGLVIVGPQATELVNAGVVGICLPRQRSRRSAIRSRRTRRWPRRSRRRPWSRSGARSTCRRRKPRAKAAAAR